MLKVLTVYFLKKIKILTFFLNPLWGHVAHVLYPIFEALFDFGNIFSKKSFFDPLNPPFLKKLKILTFLKIFFSIQFLKLFSILKIFFQNFHFFSIWGPFFFKTQNFEFF